MYTKISSFTSFENFLTSGDDKILVCEKKTGKEFLSILKKTFIFGNFFIAENISGELYESNYSNAYLLKTKDILYIIISNHYDALLIKHYYYALQNDITSFETYHNTKNISFSHTAINIYKNQVLVFGDSCHEFIHLFSFSDRLSYEYIQSFKTLISMYASLRSSFQGNAESFYDSQKSNSFLLLGHSSITISKYIREKTWITNEYEQYLHQLLNFPNKNNYNMTLTTSGLASLNLVLRYFSTKKFKKILILGEIYFENILILQDNFGKENMSFLRLEDISQDIGKYIGEHNIDAIFFDSVSISFQSQVFLKDWFEKLMQSIISAKHHVDIVIDSTTKYLTLTDYTSPQDFLGSIFYIGSIIKHISGGMDIMSGGYVLTPAKEINLCTMIPRIDADIGTLNALKIPIFPVSRHKEISNRITSCIQTTHKIYNKQKKTPGNIQVIFPQSRNTEGPLDMEFNGCLINVTLKNSKNIGILFPKHISEFQEVLKKKILEEDLDVSYSIGYGYYNTRIVLFSLDKIDGKYNGNVPYYIRISVGYSSQSDEVVKLINISSQILSFFEKKYC